MWETGDVLIGIWDRTWPTICYLQFYIEVYSPEGVLRGTIVPEDPGLPRVSCVDVYQYRMQVHGDYIYLWYRESAGTTHLIKVSRDGSVGVIAASPDTGSYHAGLITDWKGNVYYYDGVTFPSFGVILNVIKKVDSSGELVGEFHYAEDSTFDSNLFSDDSVSNQAVTMALDSAGQILYFNGTYESSGVFISASPYGVNRLDTSSGELLDGLNFDAAFQAYGLDLSHELWQLPHIISREDTLWVGVQDTDTDPETFHILKLDLDGGLLGGFPLSPIEPNEVGLDDIQFSNDQILIWTSELGGPMTAYDIDSGEIVYRWSWGTSQTRTTFFFAVASGCPLEGHIFFSRTNSDNCTFRHLSSSGVFIEDVAIPGFPIIAGNDTQVWGFTQYGASLYTSTIDYGSWPFTFKIQEWDSALNWVRDVVTDIDMSDPLQNPDERNPVFGEIVVDRIALDPDGNIYGHTDPNSQHIWVWDNDGVFLRTFELATIFNAGNSLLINPANPCIIYQDRRHPTPPSEQVFTYDLCTETQLGFELISISMMGSLETAYNCNGELFWVERPGVVLQTYDMDFNLVVNQALPSPISGAAFVYARSTSNTNRAWIAYGMGAPTSTSWHMALLDIPSNTIVKGPVQVIGPSNLVRNWWVYQCCLVPTGGGGGTVYQGLQRMEPDVDIVWSKFSGF